MATTGIFTENVRNYQTDNDVVTPTIFLTHPSLKLNKNLNHFEVSIKTIGDMCGKDFSYKSKIVYKKHAWREVAFRYTF
jgi:hypothetical protein